MATPSTQQESKNFRFELVTPSAVISAAPQRALTLPAVGGDMKVFPGHTKMVAALTQGVMLMHGVSDEPRRYFVDEGVVNVTPTECSVLTEYAIEIEDIDIEACQEKLQVLEEQINEKSDKEKSSSQELLQLEIKRDRIVAQLKAVAHLGD